MLFYNKMIYKNCIKISQENYKFDSCPLFTYEWRWNLAKIRVICYTQKNNSKYVRVTFERGEKSLGTKNINSTVEH